MTVAQIRHVTEGDLTYDAIMIWCPGCTLMISPDEPDEGGLHLLPVNSTTKTPSWTWDGSLDRPTLSPSILTTYSADRRCHSFLSGGFWDFLADCTHVLAGQTVPMPDLPDWVLESVY